MVTTARRQYPDHFLHYHRAGHGAVAWPSQSAGYAALRPSPAKMSRLQGASASTSAPWATARWKAENEEQGDCLHNSARRCRGGPCQNWHGMKGDGADHLRGVDALRLSLLPQSRPRRRHQHRRRRRLRPHRLARRRRPLAAPGLRMLEGQHRPRSMGEDARVARAFESFPEDADALYPGWRQKLVV